MGVLSTKHFIGLEEVSKKDIGTLIDVGYMFKEVFSSRMKNIVSATLHSDILLKSVVAEKPAFTIDEIFSSGICFIKLLPELSILTFASSMSKPIILNLSSEKRIVRGSPT